MERIVLEVDSSLAQAWKKVPAPLKRKFAKEIEMRMAEQIRLAEKDDFVRALSKLRKEAANNGLTQELLEELLREEA